MSDNDSVVANKPDPMEIHRSLDSPLEDDADQAETRLNLNSHRSLPSLPHLQRLETLMRISRGIVHGDDGTDPTAEASQLVVDTTGDVALRLAGAANLIEEYDLDTVEHITKKKHWIRVLTNPKTICKGILILLVVGAVLLGFYLIPSSVWEAVFGFIQSLGWWAPFFFFFFQIATCFVSIPPTFTLTFAGFLLGFWKGIIAGHISHIIGSSGSFFLARYVLARSMRKKFKDNKFFHALETAVKRSSFKIAIMLRLCPLLPIVLVTYMLSVSGVKYWHFLLATATVLLPEESFYVYFGSTASSLAKVISGNLTDGGVIQTAIMVIGVVFSIVMAIGASLVVKFQIDRVLKEEKKKKQLESREDLEAGSSASSVSEEHISDSDSDSGHASDKAGDIDYYSTPVKSPTAQDAEGFATSADTEFHVDWTANPSPETNPFGQPGREGGRNELVYPAVPQEPAQSIPAE
ncbi:SNARE associated Golgi protein [Carpediemonas membranifera]|uniref:SNARE associated Golgi protein n=1 Tax=Carpediemonas membranifera TaxID=201153 RepID=A0A8J6AZ85_9EUKA|nr:SNARE associated Golgi protein [Carpediemonas membranifera]|eukprot:KAG9389567.1 SNARE associated Golgi protein [Carpediemonas membranifera]